MSYVPDLIHRKTAGAEKETLEAADMKFFEAEYLRLLGELELAYQQSTLPEMPSSFEALDDFLVSLRLGS